MTNPMIQALYFIASPVMLALIGYLIKDDTNRAETIKSILVGIVGAITLPLL